MIGQYVFNKIWRKNPFRDRCRLQVGSTFILGGNYCEVMTMRVNNFLYRVQSNGRIYTMCYKDYLNTPSAKGRQL
jgi:hypothetical protein